MNKFKNLILILGIPILCGIVILNVYNSVYNNYQRKIELKISNNQKVNNENLTCTKSDEENMKKISQENNLDFYEGMIVKDQVAKAFTNPLIPSAYQVSINDLEEAYALGQNEQPVFLLLKFTDEEKFDKMKQFFKFGESIVGYSLSSNSNKKELFFAPDHETLDLYIKIFEEQQCY